MFKLITRRRIAGFGATAAAMLAVAACGSASSTSGSNGDSPTPSGSSSAKSKYHFVAVVPDVSDPFFQTMVCGAQQQAQTLGVSLKTYTVATLDANGVATAVNTALLTNPQGALIVPVNGNQFVTQYKTLMSHGVPVVTNNPATPQAEYKYIYTGANATQFVSAVLKSVPAGAGNMVFLGGAPGIPPLASRTVPFFQAAQKARPDLTALPTEYSGFDINKATSDVSALILAHPNLKLIIAADGPDAQAAAAALKQSGKAGKITLVGFDATPPEVAALKAGTITDLIAQPAAEIGQQSITDMVDYLKSHPTKGSVAPAGTEPLPNQLLTKANVDSPANAGYIYKTSC